MIRRKRKEPKGKQKERGDKKMDLIFEELEIEKNYTQVMYNIINTVNLTVPTVEELNNTMNEGVSSTALSSVQAFGEGLKNLAGNCINFDNVKKVMDLSDVMTQNSIQISAMNDGFHSTKELQDTIFQSAQKSRTSYLGMTDSVMQLSQGTKGVFGSNEETIQFAENLNKSFLIAGASQEQVGAATAQMTEALASGTVSGDALNSIFSAAPNTIQTIADQLGISSEELLNMAGNGDLTAMALKNALLSATDEINTEVAGIPYTWSEATQSLKDNALMAFQPILEKINTIANSSGFQTMVSTAIEGVSALANIIMGVFDLIGQLGGFIIENWSLISPVVYGVLAAFAIYAAYLGVIKGIELVSTGIKMALCVASFAKAAATGIEAASTTTATAAQMGLNASLLACPITWIVLAIIAFIAVVFLAANVVAKFSGIASSGFGVIIGLISLTFQLFKNLGLGIANIALGVGGAIGALCQNIKIAFHNAISSVQSWWYDLLSTALTVVAKICAALNKLPFVSFDYSGIETMANDYAQKSYDAKQNKEEYVDVSDAYNQKASKFDVFEEGWAANAFAAGRDLGDSIADKLSNFSITDMLGGVEMPGEGLLAEDMTHQNVYGQGVTGQEDSGIADNVETIAGNTGSMNDSIDVSEEDLQYLRELAETEIINRYTVASVTIDQTNHNNVASNMDLDGVVNGLTVAMNEAVDVITEGVYD